MKNLKWYHLLPIAGVYIAMLEDDVIDPLIVWVFQLGIYIPIGLVLLSFL